ncbi:MAG: DUF5667 domain-containing protein [bacterium]|nr:DUF5667 domain-containing protein [bacterium]
MSQEQFDKKAREFKNLQLDESNKLDIKARLLKHADTYKAPVHSPYFFSWHLSYKVLASVVVLILSVSVGTTYASQSSLPGDLLYTIKTTITEPVIKLTKKSKEDKATFDLFLADRRLQEIEELIKKDKITEERLEKNLILFEKHLDQREFDREKKETKTKSDILISEDNENIKSRNEDNHDESNKRINRYRDIMTSNPNLNSFYEKKAKVKLELRRKNAVQQEQEINEIKEEVKTEGEVKGEAKENARLEIKDTTKAIEVEIQR